MGQASAQRRKQLTGPPASAICSSCVGRAYTPAGGVPRTGMAALRRRGRICGCVAQSLAARGECLFSFGARHLPRLDLPAGGHSGRRRLAVARSGGRLRRRHGLGGDACPQMGGCASAGGTSARVARAPGARRPGATCHLKVCLGRGAARGGERGLQSDPTVTHVFRPRSRGGSSECPFWLGRRERHVGPGRTAPKTGRSNTGWIGGEPGIACDSCTDGLANMTRCSRRYGEPSQISISSGRLRSDSRVALALRSFLRARQSLLRRHVPAAHGVESRFVAGPCTIRWSSMSISVRHGSR